VTPAMEFLVHRLEMLSLALLLPKLDEEMGFLLGAALTILGTMLQWQVPRLRMSAEEHVKDGKQTEAQAARKVRVYAVCAPVITVAGGALMIWALARYLE
jgi:hypothetical protein